MTMATLIFNGPVNNIPVGVALPPDDHIVPLFGGSGFTLAARLYRCDADGNTDGQPSTLGTVAVGSNGSSIDVTPHQVGQIGFALLETVATVAGRSDISITANLLLLFVDTSARLAYDVSHITGGPVQH